MHDVPYSISRHVTQLLLYGKCRKCYKISRQKIRFSTDVQVCVRACVYILQHTTGLFQFYDSTHGICVIPTGWKMSRIQRYIPILKSDCHSVNRLANTNKKKTYMQMRSHYTMYYKRTILA